VVLATDSFLLGDGLESMLADVPEVAVVGRARDHYHLLRLVDELHPDAVIYGIRTSVITTMPTISVARHLRLEYPAMGFVIISDRANGFATELLRGGAARVAVPCRWVSRSSIRPSWNHSSAVRRRGPSIS
jgi:DNA-binding NarL/FixJ family response regulator